MIKDLGIVVQPLTPELAAEFRDMRASVGERDLSKARREYLETILANGEFHAPSWAVAWLHGKRIRVNGQGSSTVLAESNGLFPKGLTVAIHSFACDTEEDVAELFRRFDNPRSVRPPSDAMNAHAKTEPELEGTSKNCVVKAISAVASYESMVNGRSFTITDKCRMVHVYKDFILWLAPFCNHRKFTTIGVMAAAYATWKVNAAAASEFWTIFNDESHASNTHPTRQLAKFIMEARYGAKTTHGGRSKKYTTEEIYEVCIHAWNTWRAGRETKHLKAMTLSKVGDLVSPK